MVLGSHVASTAGIWPWTPDATVYGIALSLWPISSDKIVLVEIENCSGKLNDWPQDRLSLRSGKHNHTEKHHCNFTYFVKKCKLDLLNCLYVYEHSCLGG